MRVNEVCPVFERKLTCEENFSQGICLLTLSACTIGF